VWELICDQRYAWGTIAADRSPWRSDGTPFHIRPLANEAGVHFSGPDSRIAIAGKGPWLDLRGIRIEVTARLSTAVGWLIDGGTSFGMYLGQGLLIGRGRNRDVINTYDAPMTLPVGQWVTLTFEHNGLNRMRLFIDGALAATSKALNPIPGVDAGGVLIGNGFGTGRGYLRGDIESIRVWRIDPRSWEREFFARPIDRAVANCWAEFLRSLQGALRDDPDCARAVAKLLGDQQEKFFLALARKDQTQIDQFSNLCAEYRMLWRAGLLDSPAMRDFAARFRAWLIAEGLFDPKDPAFTQIADDRCFQLIVRRLAPLSCDPDLEALLRAFAGDTSNAARDEPVSSRV
jgi:hypothetical protein